MYQKYQSEAIVLRGYERGEADRVFLLYTREFGLVWARGSAVRRESSRMRYALQTFSLCAVSLIRGKNGWRIAGAAAPVPLGRMSYRAFARITHLVERLVHGEERNEYLFQTLLEAHGALEREPLEHQGVIELLCVARILYALGYISADALGSALFAHTSFALSDITEAAATRGKLLVSVNKALSETQL